MFKALQEKRKADQEKEITILLLLIVFIGITVKF